MQRGAVPQWYPLGWDFVCFKLGHLLCCSPRGAVETHADYRPIFDSLRLSLYGLSIMASFIN